MSDPNLAEEWRPVAGWESLYEVSNLGRVKSLPRRVGVKRFPGKILKGGPHPYGYRYVWLCKGGKHTHAYVHRLVLTAFARPAVDGEYALHADGDGGNNALHNLRWGTPAENSNDSRSHGTMSLGERHYNAKITDDIALSALRMAADGSSCADIAKQLDVRYMTIYDVVHRRKWKHVGI